jgi:hypothetical protein
LANFQAKKIDSDEDEPDENQIEKQAFEDRMNLVNKALINDDDGDGRIYDGTKKKPKLFSAASTSIMVGNKSKREDKSMNNNSKITNFSMMMPGADEEEL